MTIVECRAFVKVKFFAVKISLQRCAAFKSLSLRSDFSQPFWFHEWNQHIDSQQMAMLCQMSRSSLPAMPISKDKLADTDVRM